MVDLTNLLIKQIAELDPEIDLGEGSNFRDLFISPVSTLFSNYQSEHNRIVNNLTIKDPTKLTEEELDAIGANFLVTRTEGDYHTGKIKLYFSEPVSLNLPVNTTFYFEDTGYEYETINKYTGTKFAMSQTYDVDGYYSTAEISIRSVRKTADGALSSKTILKSKNGVSPSPQRIEVSSSISGGTARETNSQYYTRILNSVKTSTLASESVIESNVKAQDSAIETVKVIGSGDALMVRDLLSYNSLTPNTVENFEYVVSGQATEVYSKGHQAFVDNFSQSVVSGENPNIVFPSINA
jgi:hypothetical protein